MGCLYGTVQANHAPYMTKVLPKAIMRRSALENKYYKVSSAENKRLYRKQRNYCSKLYKKERKKYYNNLDLKNITDNKLFWKTVKPFLSDKGSKGSKITLIDDNKNIVSDDHNKRDGISNRFEISNRINLISGLM